MKPAPQKEIEFYDLFHLREAWIQIQRKRAQGGIDGVSVDEFAKHAEKHLQELSQQLQAGKYVPEPYQRIYMRQKGSSARPLGLPTVKDKVAQMAVRNAIEPIFNATFKDCSYAYRPGKGHRKAIRRVEHYLGMGNVWVTTCDIDKFFDSLVHKILLSLIEEKIKDPRILRLIKLWLKIGIVHKEEYRETDKGVPQGGIISPLLSNIYLHPFDVHMASKRINLVRYADDFVELQHSQKRAEAAYETSKVFLETRLKLKLNLVERKTWHVKKGFVFLGIQFRGYRRTISPEKFQKACTKITEICQIGRGKPLWKVIEELNESITSWRYYYGHGDTDQQFKDIEQLIQTKLNSLVHEKLGKKQIKSQSEAEKILSRLKFLILKKFAKQKRFIKAILRAPAKEKTPDEKKDQHIKGKGKPPRDEPVKSGTKPKSQAGADLSETHIKRQIAHKKKKYQRRRAESSELIVTRPRCKIGKMYERIVIRDFKGKILQQIPHMKLKHIMILAKQVSLSSDVIYMCGNAKIPIDFINYQGQPIARLSHPDFPRKEVGLAQLRAFTNRKAEFLAKTIVEAKIRNQLNLMKYFHKYRKEVDAAFGELFAQEEKRIESYLAELDELDGDWSLKQKRGTLFAIEGRAASSYWNLIRALIKDDVEFKSRQHRGASDLFNCMLNYGYGILYSRVWGAVLRAGLNPMLSFLHTDQPKSPSLVFDLIEEFRPQAVDRVMVSLIGRGERLRMSRKFLDDATRRKVLKNVLERLNIPVNFRDKQKSLAQIINYQARELAQYLQGQKPRYWPFIGKW
ncbi:MAG: group II intron reverse transcriptase/maturase [bacterium]